MFEFLDEENDPLEGFEEEVPPDPVSKNKPRRGVKTFQEFAEHVGEFPSSLLASSAPLRPTEARGSEQRYKNRQQKFREDPQPQSWLRHQALWLLHNCVAHPLLGFFPNEKTVAIHELTSGWLNKRTGNPFYLNLEVPEVLNRKAWIKHNVIAHVAIGLAPIRQAFEYHDRTAQEMGVPGWI